MSKTLVEQRPDVLLDPYGRAAIAWTEQGAALGRAGDYLVVVGHERPDGAYQPDGDGLTWRAPAPFHTVRFAVAVADAADGRFVPGLSVHLAARQGTRTFAAAPCRFHWHPVLHRYAVDVHLPPGRYDLTVRIEVPAFARDDRQAGDRYADPVVLEFPGVDLHG